MPSIDAIHGLNPKVARQLRKSGVRTTEALLRRATNKKARQEIAEACGVSEAQVTTWCNAADLMRIRGIGGEYSRLLEVLGVGSVRELKRRNPKTLLISMVELNDKKRMVRRLPTEGMVAAWVETAKLNGQRPGT